MIKIIWYNSRYLYITFFYLSIDIQFQFVGKKENSTVLVTIFAHVCCTCPYTLEIQNIWWHLIIEMFCLDLYVELSSYDDEALYQILLGKTPCTDLGDAGLKSFQKMCYFHVTKLAAEYIRAVKYIQ